MKAVLLSTCLACAVLAGCNSDSGRGSVSAKDLRAAELLAAKNANCAFEDVKFCAHMIDKRTILPQFFTPDVGSISNEERKRGRRLLTEEVVDVASKIQQCTVIKQPSVLLIPDMKINQQSFNLMATSPISDTSSCYLSKAEG